MKLPQEYFDRLLKDEGTQSPNDCFGIDRNWYPSEYVVIKHMIDSGNIEDAKQYAYVFYNNNFWHPTHCDKLDSKHLSHQLFNFAVNVGQKTAQSVFQGALNEAGLFKVKVDGFIGNITAITARYCDAYHLSDEFYKKIELHYKTIVEFDESKGKYLKGWINRASRLNLKEGSLC